MMAQDCMDPAAPFLRILYKGEFVIAGLGKLDYRLLALSCPTVTTKPRLCVLRLIGGATPLRKACGMPRRRSCIPSGLQILRGPYS